MVVTCGILCGRVAIESKSTPGINGVCLEPFQARKTDICTLLWLGLSPNNLHLPFQLCLCFIFRPLEGCLVAEGFKGKLTGCCEGTHFETRAFAARLSFYSFTFGAHLSLRS